MKTTLNEGVLDSLAQKLDEFGQVLSADEQALLLAIFRMGSSALGQAGQPGESESASAGAVKTTAGSIGNLRTPVLSQSIKSAFRPAIARGFNGIDIAAEGVEVTGGVKWSA